MDYSNYRESQPENKKRYVAPVQTIKEPVSPATVLEQKDKNIMIQLRAKFNNLLNSCAIKEIVLFLGRAQAFVQKRYLPVSYELWAYQEYEQVFNMFVLTEIIKEPQYPERRSIAPNWMKLSERTDLQYSSMKFMHKEDSTIIDIYATMFNTIGFNHIGKSEKVDLFNEMMLYKVNYIKEMKLDKVISRGMTSIQYEPFYHLVMFKINTVELAINFVDFHKICYDMIKKGFISNAFTLFVKEDNTSLAQFAYERWSCGIIQEIEDEKIPEMSVKDMMDYEKMSLLIQNIDMDQLRPTVRPECFNHEPTVAELENMIESDDM